MNQTLDPVATDNMMVGYENKKTNVATSSNRSAGILSDEGGVKSTSNELLNRVSFLQFYSNTMDVDVKNCMIHSRFGMPSYPLNVTQKHDASVIIPLPNIFTFASISWKTSCIGCFVTKEKI